MAYILLVVWVILSCGSKAFSAKCGLPSICVCRDYHYEVACIGPHVDKIPLFSKKVILNTEYLELMGTNITNITKLKNWPKLTFLIETNNNFISCQQVKKLQLEKPDMLIISNCLWGYDYDDYSEVKQPSKNIETHIPNTKMKPLSSILILNDSSLQSDILVLKENPQIIPPNISEPAAPACLSPILPVFPKLGQDNFNKLAIHDTLLTVTCFLVMLLMIILSVIFKFNFKNKKSNIYNLPEVHADNQV